MVDNMKLIDEESSQHCTRYTIAYQGQVYVLTRVRDEYGDVINTFVENEYGCAPLGHDALVESMSVFLENVEHPLEEMWHPETPSRFNIPVQQESAYDIIMKVPDFRIANPNWIN